MPKKYNLSQFLNN